MEKTKKKSAFKIILIIALIIIGILLTGKLINDRIINNNTETSLTTRAATINDISMDLNNDFSLSINYKITPKKDITNLEITFKYLNSNKKVLTTKIKQIGNVKEGTQYTVNVSLSEFSLTEIFNINYVEAEVTRGTVSLI